MFVLFTLFGVAVMVVLAFGFVYFMFAALFCRCGLLLFLLEFGCCFSCFVLVLVGVCVGDLYLFTV